LPSRGFRIFKEVIEKKYKQRGEDNILPFSQIRIKGIKSFGGI